MLTSDELDFTPPRSTARVPIFCQSCRKQGRVARRQDDELRYGGDHYSGSTMSLIAYLAGAPKVCGKCDKKVMEDMFDE